MKFGYTIVYVPDVAASRAFFSKRLVFRVAFCANPVITASLNQAPSHSHFQHRRSAPATFLAGRDVCKCFGNTTRH
jgi:hypothetical protein